VLYLTAHSATTITNTNALLGPLVEDGGRAWTRALLPDSPAINAGSCADIAGNPVATDQRGVLRISPCDIGAYGHIVWAYLAEGDAQLAIMRNLDSPLARCLVGYYGFIQTIHIIVLARAAVLFIVTGRIAFPAPPPLEGWSPQASHFLVGLGSADAVTAVLSMAFVVGYFSHARWRIWLGTLALTSAMCSAVVFAYGTIASGAWADNLLEYLSLLVAFAPVAVLFVMFGLWVIEGRFSESPADQSDNNV